MSGKYKNCTSVMFIDPQPIYRGHSNYIKGVVIPRRWQGNGKKISKDDAKKILIDSKENLNGWGVPYDVEYLEPVKDFVCQDGYGRWEEFVLSTLLNVLNKNKEILKQRVWFFELKEYTEAEE